jgi:redox-sensitive bicupin YhaK (pirin superfamily)
MGRIAIVRAEDAPRVFARDRYPEDLVQSFTEGERDSATSTYFPRADEGLELLEITFPPGAEIRPHAHASSEVVYVTKGEIHMGSQVCPVGTAVFIDSMTLYSFRAGPEGATFLNFRGEPGGAAFSKDQFMAQRDTGD